MGEYVETNTQSQARTRRRRKHRFKVTPRFWLFLFILVLLYVGSAYAVGFVKIARLNGQIRTAEQQLGEIQAANEALRDKLLYMQSDEYVEMMARTELGLVKPGETAVVVVKTDAQKDPIATERLAPSTAKPPLY